MADTTTTTRDADRTLSSPRSSKAMTVLYTIALVLLIVGGLNWALVGLFQFDLVAALFGSMSGLSRLIYILVGISALLSLGCFGRLRRT